MFHYHIRWSDSKLDWQVFNTPEEARRDANRLVRPGETYTIDKFEDGCPKCAANLVATEIKTKRKPKSS